MCCTDKNNKTAKKLQKGQKNIVKLFPKKRKEIKKYISENKINNKELKDIIKLTNYYNSLITNKK